MNHINQESETYSGHIKINASLHYSRELNSIEIIHHGFKGFVKYQLAVLEFYAGAQNAQSGLREKLLI